VIVRKPVANSASPADARYTAVGPLALLPDGCPRRRATQSGCGKSRPFDLYRSLHRRHAVASRRGYDGRHNRRYRRRRYRRHSGRIADAAGIVDRAVQSARVRGPRRNAADAGILGRRSSGDGEKTRDRHERHSSCHPSAYRNKLHAPHGPVIPYPVISGKNWQARAQVPRSENNEFQAAPYSPSYRLALVKPGWSVARDVIDISVNPPAAPMRVTSD
jgi:hypothetical protein